ncbi:MAG: hypothetical protein AWL62_2539 [Halanaerobium sp. T82-1]|nr:MAG: hypothetical protein AWL62_2539 [Halanaerobium sp. T82-1]
MNNYSVEIIHLVKEDLKKLRHQKEAAVNQIISLEKEPMNKMSFGQI